MDDATSRVPEPHSVLGCCRGKEVVHLLISGLRGGEGREERVAEVRGYFVGHKLTMALLRSAAAPT